MVSLIWIFFFPAAANKLLISLAQHLRQAAGSRKSEEESCRLDENSALIRLRKKEKTAVHIFLLGG